MGYAVREFSLKSTQSNTTKCYLTGERKATTKLQLYCLASGGTLIIADIWQYVDNALMRFAISNETYSFISRVICCLQFKQLST